MFATVAVVGAFLALLVRGHPLDSAEVETYDRSRFDARLRDNLAPLYPSDALKWALAIQQKIAEEQEADEAVVAIPTTPSPSMPQLSLSDIEFNITNNVAFTLNNSLSTILARFTNLDSAITDIRTLLDQNTYVTTINRNNTYSQLSHIRQLLLRLQPSDATSPPKNTRPQSTTALPSTPQTTRATTMATTTTTPAPLTSRSKAPRSRRSINSSTHLFAKEESMQITGHRFTDTIRSICTDGRICIAEETPTGSEGCWIYEGDDCDLPCYIGADCRGRSVDTATCWTYTCTPSPRPPAPTPDNPITIQAIVLITIGASLLVILLGGVMGWVVFRRRQQMEHRRRSINAREWEDFIRGAGSTSSIIRRGRGRNVANERSRVQYLPGTSAILFWTDRTSNEHLDDTTTTRCLSSRTLHTTEDHDEHPLFDGDRVDTSEDALVVQDRVDASEE